ncbi:hypothetical protein HHL21_15735 [Massilia sp. RP-1-19]|uniref:DUF2782 domain-containing protein n=1 Tax=Massilia polaris TaxID=2728846 RepID=A0A848HQW0_9BURK|nr:hypothetical protein [Massilia polaris]NML62499.1 hypothetical protein [Massilia polaris]
MMRTSPAVKLLALFLLANGGAAYAQTKPSDAPPKLERIEEGSDTPVTIVPQRDEQRKVRETRDGGQVREVEVKSGKSTYTMKGSNPASVTETSVGTGSTLRPPQWKVLEFDLSKKKQAQRDEEAAAAAAAAPPAAVPPPPPAK